MRFFQVPKYREYNKNYKVPLGVNLTVKSNSVKNNKNPQTFRRSEISKSLRHHGHDYIVRNYDKPLIYSTNGKNELFPRFHRYGKTKKEENRVLSAKERQQERQEAKLKKLQAKQQKLFRKSLLIEIERCDINKRIKELQGKNSSIKELQAKNGRAEPVSLGASEPFTNFNITSSRKIRSATTQCDPPKVEKKCSDRRNLLATKSKSKRGLLSKCKPKKEQEIKRKPPYSKPPFSKRFVNCFYRTCCRIYCCITFIVLIVGIWVILFMPLS